MNKKYLASFIVVVLVILAGIYLAQKEPSTGSTLTYHYPETLSTKYIRGAIWPPSVKSVDTYDCITGNIPGDNGRSTDVVEKMIGNREYCLSTSIEAAAGSRYTSYKYVTKQGDFVYEVSFTLQYPQCLNYENPEQSQCQLEQTTFDVDDLADRIVSSINLQ